MNRKREIDLARLSRIGDLATKQNTAWENHKGRPVGTLSIEAAIGKYIDRKNTDVSERRKEQDNYIKVKNNDQMVMHAQMSEYISTCKDVRKGKNTGYVYTGYYEKNENKDESENIYDKLDEHRCPAFLLYSYDRNGVHSELGIENNGIDVELNRDKG